MQGSEHEAFIAVAKAEVGAEFVQTTVAEVVQVFAEGSISPPFVAVRKQEPEYFTAFGMDFGFCTWLRFSLRLRWYSLN